MCFWNTTPTLDLNFLSVDCDRVLTLFSNISIEPLSGFVKKRMHFIKVDLRIAKVINAKELEDSRKLLELEVDLGDETRTIFAGIKKSYTPEQLIGKLVVVIANLKPRKMKFGVSNGMVLATQHDGDIIILQPEKDVAPGSKIS